jgi:hypothetical protein
MPPLARALWEHRTRRKANQVVRVALQREKNKKIKFQKKIPEKIWRCGCPLVSTFPSASKLPIFLQGSHCFSCKEENARENSVFEKKESLIFYFIFRGFYSRHTWVRESDSHGEVRHAPDPVSCRIPADACLCGVCLAMHQTWSGIRQRREHNLAGGGGLLSPAATERR